ncbi:MmgE/PrpD family protein [Microbispora sp. CA-102843]|uniref:MmgE/PrpD family protein n=1 Tax=Microbispora sp. CA-102843 TaxID=3239952 RepID=UPI003D8A4C6E
MAKWATDLGYEDIPEAIAHQARMSLLDTIGCVVAGFSHPDNQNILSADRELSAAGGKNAATVAVSGDPLSVPAAAKVNSCLASILELDDNTAGHASLVTVPVGLAVAEAYHLSGRDLITSMVSTYEVVGRVLDSVFDTLKPYSECAIVPIAAPNTIGAAAQTAKLLGLDTEGTFDAINVGLTFLPFSPMVNAKVGSQVKPLLFSGWHVYAGSFGAMYAKAGLTAANDSYESEYGGYLRSVATSWNAEVLTEGLGQSWHLDAPNRKRHACCGYIHSSIDGCWDMLREHHIAIDSIARIHVDLPRDAFGLVGSPLLGDLTPRGAQFYLPYVLAVGLVENRPILPADTCAEALDRHLANPNFARLMESIGVSLDPDISGRFSCRLQLITKDGREYKSFVQDAVGRGERQFTVQEVEEKFHTLASTELNNDAVDQIVEMVHNIEQVEDVSELTTLLKR